MVKHSPHDISCIATVCQTNINRDLIAMEVLSLHFQRLLHPTHPPAIALVTIDIIVHLNLNAIGWPLSFIALLLLHGLLQAAVICQDSVLELCLPGGPASSLSTGTAVPRLSRSVSKDTGLDAGEAAMMRRQLAALQEEVARLKPLEAQLGESEKARAQAEKQLKDMVPKGHRRNRGKGNKGEVGDALKVE